MSIVSGYATISGMVYIARKLVHWTSGATALGVEQASYEHSLDPIDVSVVNCVYIRALASGTSYNTP